MIDRASKDWPALKTWLLGQIAERHLLLEADADEITHARIRGEVGAFRKILETVDPKMVPLPVAPADYRQ